MTLLFMEEKVNPAYYCIFLLMPINPANPRARKITVVGSGTGVSEALINTLMLPWSL